MFVQARYDDQKIPKKNARNFKYFIFLGDVG